MLVLTRRIGQTIHIGPNVRVVVIDITGYNVRLGIEAPRGINIWRGDLQQCEAPDEPNAAAPRAVKKS